MLIDRFFRYLSRLDLAGGRPPVSVQIFEEGEWVHPVRGKFIVTEEKIDEIISNKSENDIPIDYQHGSSSNSTDPEMSKAAGWIKKLFKKTTDAGKELWAIVEWTEQAAQYIINGEFKYISPSYLENAEDHKTGKYIGGKLYAAALTNTPFIEGMAPVHARAQLIVLAENVAEELERGSVMQAFSDIMYAFQTQIRKRLDDGEAIEAIMKYVNEECANIGMMIKQRLSELGSAAKMALESTPTMAMRKGRTILETIREGEVTMELKQIAQLFGFSDPDKTTEEQIKTFISTLRTDGVILKELRDILHVPDGKSLVDQVKALVPVAGSTMIEASALKALNDRVVTLEARAVLGEQAAAELRAMKKDELINGAIRARKLAPSLKGWAESEYDRGNLESLKAFIKDAPEVVDFSVRGSDQAMEPLDAASLYLAETKKVQMEKPGRTIREAMELVDAVNPELRRQYEAERNASQPIHTVDLAPKESGPGGRFTRAKR